jgi:hypothetical protein
MKNIFHAEMALLIRREKEIDEKLQELSREYATWKDRVELAEKTGRNELAQRAQERLDQVRAEASELRSEQKRLHTMKKKVRYESRRPSGNEVQRAQALLEGFRQSGLIDPEEAALDAAFENLAKGRPAGDAPQPSTKSEPAQKSEPGKTLDDLDLDDLENLDLDELDALVGGTDK